MCWFKCRGFAPTCRRAQAARRTPHESRQNFRSACGGRQRHLFSLACGRYWAGKAGIPSIGFAPSDEIYAHTLEDQVPIEDVVQATSWYGLLPLTLQSLNAGK